MAPSDSNALRPPKFGAQDAGFSPKVMVRHRLISRVLEGICLEGRTGGDVVIVSRDEVDVEMGDAVAEDQIVELPRPIAVLDGPSDVHDLCPEASRLFRGEGGRLNHVATLPDDVGVPRTHRPPSEICV